MKKLYTYLLFLSVPAMILGFARYCVQHENMAIVRAHKARIAHGIEVIPNVEYMSYIPQKENNE